MLTMLEDGQLYIIRAEAKSLKDLQLCRGLWETMNWDTRPHRVNSRRSEYNDHIVFAVTSPSEDSARIFDRRASSISTVEIELLNQDKIDKKAGWTGMRTYQTP